MIYSSINIFINPNRIGNSFIQGILFVVLVSLLFSCASIRKIGIEVAVPPEYPIGEDVNSILLINRSITDRFTNTNSDSLQKFLGKNNMVIDSVFQDSLVADTVLQVTARALFESGRFDAVIPMERNIVRTDHNEIIQPLDKSQIVELCNDFKVDAVLVLESFLERLSTKYSYIYYEDAGYYGYYATTDVTYLAEWRLYRPNDLKPVIRFQVGDSIFWKEDSNSLENVYARMPSTKEALIGGGIASGYKMANYISPGWVSQTRHYYTTGNKDIDAAIPLINVNKWEEAADLWRKYASVPSKTIRSKVEFNLALAAEMNGDLDLAIEWGLKSFKSRYTKAVEVYLKTLDDKLKAQLSENKKRY